MFISLISEIACFTRFNFQKKTETKEFYNQTVNVDFKFKLRTNKFLSK